MKKMKVKVSEITLTHTYTEETSRKENGGAEPIDGGFRLMNERQREKRKYEQARKRLLAFEVLLCLN